MSVRDGSALAFRLLARVSGLPCWGILNGWGSFLSLKFGTPALHIRQYKKWPQWGGAPRRMVVVEGQHSIFVQMSDWAIRINGRRIAHNESDRAVIAKAARRLEGQILVGVRWAPKAVSTTFEFDLGGELSVRRYRDYDYAGDEALWSFHARGTGSQPKVMAVMPNGQILSGTQWYGLPNNEMHLTKSAMARRRSLRR